MACDILVSLFLASQSTSRWHCVAVISLHNGLRKLYDLSPPYSAHSFAPEINGLFKLLDQPFVSPRHLQIIDKKGQNKLKP
jgi:hypothetical protein